MDIKNVFLECPLALNVARTKDYLLPCQERNFFDFMVLQQLRNDIGKCFSLSRLKIGNELGLKRRTIERVEKRFCAMGILQTTTSKNPNANNGGQTMFYSVSYARIVEKLNEIIYEQSESFVLFKNWFALLAKEQKKAINTNVRKNKATATEITKSTKELYENLCEMYKSRLEIYNENPNISRLKLYAKFPCSIEELKGIQRLAQRYDNKTILNAFLVFCDEVLNNKRKGVKNHLKNFAFFDAQNNQFKVFDECLNKYLFHYGQDK